jgi:HTH-type transcriptional regulator, bacterioopsin transcriptional activator and related proteins
VNDDEDTLFLVATAVTREFPDAELLTCNSADAALALLRAEAVDAIVTDNRMPGTSGIAMVEAIRATDSNTIILMLTGAENVRNEALAAGVTAFMTTSSWNEVRQKLKELLGPPRG